MGKTSFTSNTGSVDDKLNHFVSVFYTKKPSKHILQQLLHTYLSNGDKLGEVCFQVFSFECLVEVPLPLFPVLIIGILDGGRTNQRFKSLEQ